MEDKEEAEAFEEQNDPKVEQKPEEQKLTNLGSHGY